MDSACPGTALSGIATRQLPTTMPISTHQPENHAAAWAAWNAQAACRHGQRGRKTPDGRTPPLASGRSGRCAERLTCGHGAPYRNYASVSHGPDRSADAWRPGGMAERFKAPVLKTGVGASSPWVRIPLPPPDYKCDQSLIGNFATPPNGCHNQRSKAPCGCRLRRMNGLLGLQDLSTKLNVQRPSFLIVRGSVRTRCPLHQEGRHISAPCRTDWPHAGRWRDRRHSHWLP